MIRGKIYVKVQGQLGIGITAIKKKFPIQSRKIQAIYIFESKIWPLCVCWTCEILPTHKLVNSTDHHRADEKKDSTKASKPPKFYWENDV